MNTLDPYEMVRYFSDFLTEINIIIKAIKKYTYQIVDVNIPCPTILQVCHSMASIITSTHKTYDDLKRIQSVMTGVVKARRMLQKKPLTLLQNRFRCRSEEVMSNQHEKIVKNRNKLNFAYEATNFSNQDKTIKRNSNSNGLQLDIPTDLGKQITDRKINDGEISKQQDNKTVKYVTDRGSQSSNDMVKPLNSMKKWLEQRIQKIVSMNRVGMSKIMNSNVECLRLVRSAKKQMISKN